MPAEEPAINGIPRSVEVTTLDRELAALLPDVSPLLLKADVQGGELIVLDGAREALARAASTRAPASRRDPTVPESPTN